jgi:hypothetical protein
LRVNLFKFKNIQWDVYTGDIWVECKYLRRVGEGEKKIQACKAKTCSSIEGDPGGRGEQTRETYGGEMTS